MLICSSQCFSGKIGESRKAIACVQVENRAQGGVYTAWEKFWRGQCVVRVVGVWGGQKKNQNGVRVVGARVLLWVVGSGCFFGCGGFLTPAV